MCDEAKQMLFAAKVACRDLRLSIEEKAKHTILEVEEQEVIPSVKQSTNEPELTVWDKNKMAQAANPWADQFQSRIFERMDVKVHHTDEQIDWAVTLAQQICLDKEYL